MDQPNNNADSGNSIRQQRYPKYRKIVKLMWGATILGILGVILLFVILSFQDLPTFEELENPNSNFASELYAADGEVLGRYYVENRIPVDFDQLSPYLVKALVATEDERYYGHSGIDFEALSRVIVRTGLMGQRSAGGGSTITQQLAKLLYSDRNFAGMNFIEKIFALGTRKFKEWITAVKLERSYTKEEIMAMYLNKFSFTNGAYGIKAASEIYFGTSQDSLRIEEAATLVGMLKNPSLYNPIRRPDITTKRREVVLKQMQKAGHISQEDYNTLRVLPLDMSNFRRKTHADGLAPYFRMELRKELSRILNRPENLKTNGEPYDIYRDGLKIYTTIDPKIQAHAEVAMYKHMEKLQRTFDRHWKGKDPWTYEDNDTDMEPEEMEQDLATRARSLQKSIRESDRYQRLRAEILEPAIKTAAKKLDGFELRDHDIDRMIQEEREKGTIARLVSQKLVGSPLAAKYKKLLKSDEWKEVKAKFITLRKAATDSFNKATKMRVFAYNEQMEKDTTMTPLDSIKYHQMFLQLGSIAVDPKTGYVKAWVGGINHKYFQFDHVTSERQVGSTFKPFIYATAIAQQSVSPCMQVYDLPYTIHAGEGNFHLKEDWTPNNANGEYSGAPYTLFKGLQHSKNTVSVYLMKQLGDAEPVRDLVDNMGLSKDAKRSNGTYVVPHAPSICLGSCELTVQELAGAYTTFANDGIYNKPVFINRIEDGHGHVIYEEIQEERRALNPNANYVMVNMLESVMKQGLPGFGNIKSEVGGKTGTTNNYVDGWFVGLTPDLVVTTWVGGDNRWVRFRSLNLGIGAKMARPFFAKLLRSLEEDETIDYDVNARFAEPTGNLGIVIDCEQYDYQGESPLNFDDMVPVEENENFGDDDFFGDESPAVNDTTKNKQIAEENEEFGEEF